RVRVGRVAVGVHGGPPHRSLVGVRRDGTSFHRPGGRGAADVGRDEAAPRAVGNRAGRGGRRGGRAGGQQPGRQGHGEEGGEQGSAHEGSWATGHLTRRGGPGPPPPGGPT